MASGNNKAVASAFTITIAHQEDVLVLMDSGAGSGDGDTEGVRVGGNVSSGGVGEEEVVAMEVDAAGANSDSKGGNRGASVAVVVE